jgi:hypothetical protein
VKEYSPEFNEEKEKISGWSIAGTPNELIY